MAKFKILIDENRAVVNRTTKVVSYTRAEEVVEADEIIFPNGAIVFFKAFARDQPRQVFKAFAPGQWKTVERTEEERP